MSLLRDLLLQLFEPTFLELLKVLGHGDTSLGQIPCVERINGVNLIHDVAASREDLNLIVCLLAQVVELVEEYVALFSLLRYEHQLLVLSLEHKRQVVEPLRDENLHSLSFLGAQQLLQLRGRILCAGRLGSCVAVASLEPILTRLCLVV